MHILEDGSPNLQREKEETPAAWLGNNTIVAKMNLAHLKDWNMVAPEYLRYDKYYLKVLYSNDRFVYQSDRSEEGFGEREQSCLWRNYGLQSLDFKCTKRLNTLENNEYEDVAVATRSIWKRQGATLRMAVQLAVFCLAGCLLYLIVSNMWKLLRRYMFAGTTTQYMSRLPSFCKFHQTYEELSTGLERKQYVESAMIHFSITVIGLSAFLLLFPYHFATVMGPVAIAGWLYLLCSGLFRSFWQDLWQQDWGSSPDRSRTTVCQEIPSDQVEIVPLESCIPDPTTMRIPAEN